MSEFAGPSRWRKRVLLGAWALTFLLCAAGGVVLLMDQLHQRASQRVRDEYHRWSMESGRLYGEVRAMFERGATPVEYASRFAAGGPPKVRVIRTQPSRYEHHEYEDASTQSTVHVWFDGGRPVGSPGVTPHRWPQSGLTMPPVPRLVAFARSEARDLKGGLLFAPFALLIFTIGAAISAPELFRPVAHLLLMATLVAWVTWLVDGTPLLTPRTHVGPFLLVQALLWWTGRPADLPAASALCPNCQYNLTGNTSGDCPECGWKLDDEFRYRQATNARWRQPG